MIDIFEPNYMESLLSIGISTIIMAIWVLIIVNMEEDRRIR